MKDSVSIFYVLTHVKNRLRRAAVIFCVLILLLISISACGMRGGAYIYNYKHDSVPGLLDDTGDNGSVYILYIHGMGNTPESFARPLIKQAERLLSVTAEEKSCQDIQLPHPLSLRGEAISEVHPIEKFGRLCRFVFENNGREVNLYSYYWNSDASDLQKYYTYTDFQVKEQRALFNKAIKNNIVNYGFSDAALYLGNFGYVMRQGLEGALCVMLSEATEREVKNGACLLSDLEDKQKNIENLQIKFVAKSLGSRYLFDTLSHLDQIDSLQRLGIKHNVDFKKKEQLDFGEEGNQEASAVVKTIQTKKAVIKSITDVFFLANQLPLLGLGQIRADTTEIQKIRDSIYCRYVEEGDNCGTNSIDLDHSPYLLLLNGSIDDENVDGSDEDSGKHSGLDFFTFMNDVRGEDKGALNVVAFHDPNDILGFKAGEHLMDKAKEQFNFIEIVHHNASNVCCLWASPLEAHAKEDERPTASQIIWCGGTVLKSGRVEPKSCR